MLAGHMKLNTFLLLVGAGAGALVAGGGVWLALRSPAEPAPVTVKLPVPSPDVVNTAPAAALPPTNADSVTTQAPAANPAAAAAPVVAPPGARPVDVVVLSYVNTQIGTDKLKDVSRGKPFKVNVYQDAGKAVVNRAKVDLNRNDKWDEKFTFSDGTIVREVAPADDENYTVKHRWDGKDWVEGG